MKLLAAEIRLLQAARKLIDGGESISLHYFGAPFESHEISLHMALDHCEKYFHGSHSSYSIAKQRLHRSIQAANGQQFWSNRLIRALGYSYWKELNVPGGGNMIVNGDVTEETFNNWCILANLAYIDRMIETGEVR